MKDLNTSQGRIKHKVVHNPIVNVIYKSKFYFNVMMEEVGYVTNKLPEIAGVIIIAEKLGWIIPASWIIPGIIIGYAALVGLGWIWKRIGLYDTARYIEAHRNPVQDEILKAARIIEQKFGPYKKEKGDTK